MEVRIIPFGVRNSRFSGELWHTITFLNTYTYLEYYENRNIGTGAIGSTIAHKLVNAGHQVKVNNTAEMSKLKKTAENLGATAATIYDVVKDVDVVIFSTPFSALADLPEDLLKKVPKEVIIVDTT